MLGVSEQVIMPNQRNLLNYEKMTIDRHGQDIFKKEEDGSAGASPYQTDSVK